MFITVIKTDTRRCQLDLRRTTNDQASAHTLTLSRHFIIPDNNVYGYRPFFFLLQLSSDAFAFAFRQAQTQYPPRLPTNGFAAARQRRFKEDGGWGEEEEEEKEERRGRKINKIVNRETD